MTNDADLLTAIRSLSTRAAEFAAFENTLRELNSTLADLLHRSANTPAPQMPDLAGPLAAAMAGLRLPVPMVTSPVTVMSGAKTGDRWSVSYTRTLNGGEMIVTKL